MIAPMTQGYERLEARSENDEDEDEADDAAED